MLGKIKRIFKAEGRALLKKLERPIPILKEAKNELFEKAVACQTKAEELKRVTAPVGKEKEWKQLIEKLEAQAVKHKRLHAEYEGKIAELEAKKMWASTMLSVMRAENGLFDDSPQAAIKEIEADIAKMEDEVNALLKLESV